MQIQLVYFKTPLLANKHKICGNQRQSEAEHFDLRTEKLTETIPSNKLWSRTRKRFSVILKSKAMITQLRICHICCYIHSDVL